MNIQQKGEFKKAYKKLHTNQLDPVNDVIRAIIANPEIGIEKSGDLSRFRVCKFKVLDQVFLLAYQIEEEILTLRALSTHENFYRDMKK